MYRFIKQSSALALVVFAMVQCTNVEDITIGGGSHDALSPKIINTSSNAVEGSLLIQFNDDAITAFESASRSNAVTRSNIEALNKVLLDINATKIERVFPVSAKSEERTRNAGLHRWYVVNFDKEYSLDDAARALATVSEVELVEFNTCIELRAPQPQGRVNMRATTRLAVPTFDDPLASQQWDLYNDGTLLKEAVAGMDINVREAWKYTTGDPSVIVAVVDQGVDYTHEDLAANMWVNEGEIANNGIDDDKNGYIDDIHGWNFVTNGPLSWDKYFPDGFGDDATKIGDVGHGTHVAGTIAAVNNNGKGICGIAGGDGTPNRGVRIMSLQVYSGNDEGTGSTEAISKAFQYASEHGAAIANCSWGSPAILGENDGSYTQSRGLQHKAMQAFCQVSNHPNLNRNIIICAAGNNYTGQSNYPGGYREYISVTSFGIDGNPAPYTNYGPGCNISAPGGYKGHGENGEGGILSTLTPSLYGNDDSGYGCEQGTSMACPHVTGVAALGLSYAKKIGKKLTADEFKAKILLSVNDMGNDIPSKYLGKMGTGRIDAFRMLMNIEGIACIPVPRGKRFYEIDLKPYLADGKVNLRLIDEGVTISSKDMKSLGMDSEPIVQAKAGKIVLTCNNTGSAIISVKMVAGGEVAGSPTTIGGMEITQQFALIVRDDFADNGGWL